MITQLARQIAQTRRVRFGSKAAVVALRRSIALGQERSSYSVESAVRYAAWDDAMIGGDIAPWRAIGGFWRATTDEDDHYEYAVAL